MGQRAVRGRALIGLAWAMGLLGAALLSSGSALLKTHLPLWSRLVVVAAAFLAGGVFFGSSFHLFRRGKQHRARVITSFDELDGSSYLLYLRPFAIDPGMASRPPEAPGALFRSPFELPGLTVEQFLIRQFAPLGRVVAIGEPGERLPQLGADRGYVPVDDWQDTVSGLIRGAHAVLISAAPGPGTVWEFLQALHTVPPARLVLLVYGTPADYDAFRAAAAREYAVRSAADPAAWPPLPRLPDFPGPPTRTKGLTWDFPLKGIVTFDDDWRASLTRFDPDVPRVRWVWTLRRLVRRELEPVLGPLSQLPPAQPCPNSSPRRASR